MREAAAVPLIFTTAWEGLVGRADIRAGHDLLVQGGAGGAGEMALQIARAKGATISATGSPAARAATEQLGARFVDRAEPVTDVVARLTGERRAAHGQILSPASALAESGNLIPSLDPRHFTMRSVADAYQAISNGTVRGKIVIEIDTNGHPEDG